MTTDQEKLLKSCDHGFGMDNAIQAALAELTRLRALNVELVAVCKAARHQLRHGAPHLMTPVDDVVQQIDTALAKAQAAGIVPSSMPTVKPDRD